MYLQAVGALQVSQGPFHQGGQVLVDGLVADVVQAVVAAETRPNTQEGSEDQRPWVGLREDPES